MSSRGARLSSPSSLLERPASQDSQDSMEDYWSEVKNIEEDGERAHEDLLERGSMDEAELEEAWLQEAGLSTLVSGELGEGPAEALLSTLTRSQAAMVKKRVDNYTLTMRKRNKQPARHVQDVFSTLFLLNDYGLVFCLTHIQDLSCEDMKKIGYISLIELTTFYDCLGIELKRNRAARSKARESGIFGVPLTTLLENDQKKFPGSKVPLVFRKLLSKLEQTGLQTEGILRVPGSASRVKHLRQELEQKFYEERFDWEQVRHNDAAGLLKMFIRELPYPLLTLQHLPAFAAAQSVSSPRHQIQALHLLIMLLPEPNRDTLKALLEFLRKVVAYEEKNRMSLWNVSMIVAPNLFTYRGKNAKQEEMQGAAGAAHLVRLLITYQELLWTVPCFLISHVRKLNEASKKPPSSEKTKRKLLLMRKRNAEKTERSELTDLREGVIRVHAPLHAKISMAIQLDNETKAKDVMARFDYENGSTSQRPVQYLFEVGGNIGERCLDPETHLLDVYHVNPHCEWLLKPTTT
uniref:Rho GTPase activating protein 28 n=1 Tax=Salmo trutta TaxID=8032 RepID=A0A674CII3_SALTR